MSFVTNTLELWRTKTSAFMLFLPARYLLALLWAALILLGAVNHTLLPRLLHRHVNLLLPNLRYGYVMFNIIPTSASVVEFRVDDSSRNWSLSELSDIQTPGYARTRVLMDVFTAPKYLDELCLRRQARTGSPVSIVTHTYQINGGKPRMTGSVVHACADERQTRRQ